MMPIFEVVDVPILCFQSGLSAGETRPFLNQKLLDLSECRKCDGCCWGASVSSSMQARNCLTCWEGLGLEGSRPLPRIGFFGFQSHPQRIGMDRGPNPFRIGHTWILRVGGVFEFL